MLEWQMQNKILYELKSIHNMNLNNFKSKDCANISILADPYFHDMADNPIKILYYFG